MTTISKWLEPARSSHPSLLLTKVQFFGFCPVQINFYSPYFSCVGHFCIWTHHKKLLDDLLLYKGEIREVLNQTLGIIKWDFHLGYAGHLWAVLWSICVEGECCLSQLPFSSLTLVAMHLSYSFKNISSHLPKFSVLPTDEPIFWAVPNKIRLINSYIII